MSKIIKINAYFFGKISVQLNVSFITEMMNSLSEAAGISLFPNVIPGQKVDLIAGKAEQISNIMFRSQNDDVQVTFAETSLNCCFNFPANQEESDSFLQEQFLRASNVMNAALNSFGQIGSRLAVNIDMIGPEQEDGNFQLSQLASTYAPYYNEKEIIDFSMQINARKNISILELADEINVISNYSIVQNNVTKKKLVLCHLDLNTIPENTKIRFSSVSLAPFLQQIHPVINEIKQNFNEREH